MKTPTPFSVRSGCGKVSHLPSGERCKGRDCRERRKLFGSPQTELCVPFPLASLSRAAVIRFETNYQGYRGGKSPTTYRDFVIADVHADQASAYVLFVEGLEELPSREVLLRDVVIRTHGRPLVQEYRLWLKRP